MTDNSKRTGAAVEAHYQFLMWLVLTLDKFPRSQKFTVGDRIQSTALDVLETLIAATYTRDRAQYLRRANLGIEKLRFFLRLAVDLRLLDRRRYETTLTFGMRPMRRLRPRLDVPIRLVPTLRRLRRTELCYRKWPR